MFEAKSIHLVVWQSIAITAAGVTIAYAATGLSVDPQLLYAQTICLVAILGIRFVAKTPNPTRDTFVSVLECIALFCAISLLGSLACLPLVHLAGDFQDPLLQRADDALNFDWMALYRFTAEHPTYSLLTRLAYRSLSLSPAIVIIGLCCSGRLERAHLFLLAFFIALVITIAIFPFAPARGPIYYHLASSTMYRPVCSFEHIGIIESVRSGALTHITFEKLYGLINFPSFHTASALMFIFFAWPNPIIRVPIFVANLALIAATPIEGAHYLIDIFGGVAVAVTAIASAKWLAAALAKGKPLSAQPLDTPLLVQPS